MGYTLIREKKETSLQLLGITDNTHSVQSSLKYHSLWVTLYTPCINQNLAHVPGYHTTALSSFFNRRFSLIQIKVFLSKPPNFRHCHNYKKAIQYNARTTCVHLNIRAGPTFAVLVWTVPPIYNYVCSCAKCISLMDLKLQTCNINP